MNESTVACPTKVVYTYFGRILSKHYLSMQNNNIQHVTFDPDFKQFKTVNNGNN